MHTTPTRIFILRALLTLNCVRLHLSMCSQQWVDFTPTGHTQVWGRTLLYVLDCAVAQVCPMWGYKARWRSKIEVCPIYGFNGQLGYPAGRSGGQGANCAWGWALGTQMGYHHTPGCASRGNRMSPIDPHKKFKVQLRPVRPAARPGALVAGAPNALGIWSWEPKWGITTRLVVLVEETACPQSIHTKSLKCSCAGTK